jgi:hypothetical protein
MKVSKLRFASLAFGSWLVLGAGVHAQQLVQFDCEGQEGENCSGQIPDNNVSGLVSTLRVAKDTCPAIFDVRVKLKIEHGWVGDLVAELEHDDIRTAFLDRPGTSKSLFGCAGDNVDATFFTMSPMLMEDQCGFLNPAIQGAVSPSHPFDDFVGEAGGGEWSLRVIDGGPITSAGFDVSGDEYGGRLLGWSLVLQCSPTVPAQTLPWVLALAMTLTIAGIAVLGLRDRKRVSFNDAISS